MVTVAYGPLLVVACLACLVGCASCPAEPIAATANNAPTTTLGSVGTQADEFTFGPITRSSVDAMSVLTDRVLVRELRFSRQSTLSGVTFQVPQDSPRWAGTDPIALSEVRVASGGRLVSWVVAANAMEPTLAATLLADGSVRLTCDQVCDNSPAGIALTVASPDEIVLRSRCMPE